VALAEAMLHSLALARQKLAAGLLLLVSTLAIGAGVLAYQIGKGSPESAAGAELAYQIGKGSPESAAGEQAQASREREQPEEAPRPSAPVDVNGDPLPPGALVRTVGSHSVAFSPDGKIVASSQDFKVRLWAVATGKEIRIFQGHKGQITAVAFSPDGRTLASGGRDSKVRLWDVASGKEIHALGDHGHGVSSVAFSPDGKVLVSGHTRMIMLWETATGKGTIHAGALFQSVAFSPDGKTVASASNNGLRGCIQLQDVATGKSRVLGDQNSPFSVAFAPDGKLLASGNLDQTIQLFETASGKEIRALRGHEGPVTCLAFAPDGKILASGGEDSKVRLWEVASGKEIRSFPGHKRSVTSVAFAPDGKSVASASFDTVMVWTASGRTARPTASLAAERLPELWAQFADADIPKAYDALWTLVAAPRQSVPFLEQQLKADPIDARGVAAQIADLNSDQFAVRQKAEQELEKLDKSVVPALRNKLKDKPASEMRQRIEALLQKLDGPILSPLQLRIIRAVQVLEHIGNADARKLLDKLAQGPPEARLTQEVKAALERLSKRTATSP